MPCIMTKKYVRRDDIIRGGRNREKKNNVEERIFKRINSKNELIIQEKLLKY